MRNERERLPDTGLPELLLALTAALLLVSLRTLLCAAVLRRGRAPGAANP